MLEICSGQEETCIESLIYFISSSLSMFGSSIIFITFYFVKELRKPPFSVIIYLSLCDFCFSFKFFMTALLPTFSGGFVCMLQAAWGQFWGMGSISWNGIVALEIFMLLRNPLHQRNFQVWYHIFVWTLAGSTSALIVVLGVYGPSFDGTTCWIAVGNKLAHLIFFIPLGCYLIMSLFCILLSALRVRSIFTYRKGQRTTFIRMLLYVFVFIIVWSWPIFHLGVVLFGEDQTWMHYVDALFVGLQGFANSLVWLSRPYFISRLKRSPICIRIDHCYASQRTKSFEKGKSNMPSESTSIISEDEFEGFTNRIRLNIMCAILSGIHAVVEQGRKKADEERRSNKKLLISKKLTSVDYDDSISVTSYQPKFSGSEMMNITHKGCKFTEYAPKAFQRLREIFGIRNEDLLNSLDVDRILEHFNNQKFSEGRSGSFFTFTPDKKFILKTISYVEFSLLRNILIPYAEYLSEHRDSYIVHFYGLYSLNVSFAPNVYIISMNNLFYSPYTIDRRYDLKGSWIKREVGEAHNNEPSSVLGMDRDFLSNMNSIKVGPKMKQNILATVSKDSMFLASLGIIDYSLLLGIHIAENHPPNDMIDIIDERNDPPEIFSSSQNNLFNTNIFNSNILNSQMGDFANINPIFNNGIRSIDGKYIYFIGLIDILQLYDCNKQSEYVYKVCLKCQNSVISH